MHHRRRAGRVRRELFDLPRRNRPRRKRRPRPGRDPRARRTWPLPAFAIRSVQSTSGEGLVQPERWFGESDSPRESRIGVRAAGEALVGDGAKLLIVFCSQALDLPAVVGQIRETAGEVPLIGCTTAGEIAAASARDPRWACATPELRSRPSRRPATISSQGAVPPHRRPCRQCARGLGASQRRLRR